MTAFDPVALGLRAASPGAATTPRDSLDQGDFLTLLVTQLKNQDPLNPLDNETFVAQLAQFSTVSGITESNKSLEGLLALARTGATQAAPAWLGRMVEPAEGPAGEVSAIGIGADGAVSLQLSDGRRLAIGDVRRLA